MKGCIKRDLSTMKKGALLIGVAAIFLIVSCGTPPAPAAKPPAEAPAEAPRAAPPPSAPIPVENLILDGATSYTVVRGDTLSKIAGTFYGEENSYFFPIIVLASGEAVPDPDLIYPGTELLIPNLDRNLGNVGAKGKVRTLIDDTAGGYEQKAKPKAADRLRELVRGL
ncbi:MAG: LysM peptidoglycan-binding domain-containing protein [Treponema sp.]|jgi:LysM repeat protein|nr:LysM peptidoglycan-binding domain-containing protein [Treponema sp.]